MYFKYSHLILVSRCNSITGVTNSLNDCKDGMSLVLDMENEIIQKELISDDPNLPGILSLEYSLLDIGCTPCLTQGIFYMMLIIFGTKVFVR